MFQLKQNNAIISASTTVDGLAFSKLCGRMGWLVEACFPQGTCRVVTVTWPPSEGYTATLRRGLGAVRYTKPLYHSTIIPTVKRILSAACEGGELAGYRLAGEWSLRIAPIGENLW